MKLLLDTHTFLWFIAGNPNLSSNARSLIEDVTNDKFVSPASLWEIAIKFSLGRLPLSAPFDVLIPEQMSINGFELLPMEIEHIAAVATLPHHHRDPFDRLLAAQSLVEQMPVVGIDTAFDAYGVNRLW